MSGTPSPKAAKVGTQARVACMRAQALARKAFCEQLRRRVAAATTAARWPDGLAIVPDILTSDEEQCLLTHIDSMPWRTDLRRRVQHYGWVYNYKARSVAARDYIGALPDWVEMVSRRLVLSGLVRPTTVFDQAIINEYVPGQGIAAHVDKPQLFDDEIVMVTLNSGVPMQFQHRPSKPASRASAASAASHRGDNRTIDLWLKPRSAVRICGEARYDWTHAILARKTDRDPVTNRQVPRGRRVSITLRSMRSPPKAVTTT